MFENISQGLFVAGGIGYSTLVPILRLVVSLLMVISTYKILKVRQDKHKLVWILFIWISPIITRISYEIYRRWIAEKTVENVSVNKASKASNVFLVLSIIIYAAAIIITFVSVVTMGIGVVKSYVDDEPIAAAYDVYGNMYSDYIEVPLFDQEGNTYTPDRSFKSLLTNDYIDQNGNVYNGMYCYLDENGYFYYDKNNELVPYDEYNDYFTDGEVIYYDLFGTVYWNEDGTIYAKSGRYTEELFDFECLIFEGVKLSNQHDA
ncbi:MAG: hypothetical protein J1E36_03415 [Eubacterium sp.]|nr:hypothetical protein [Eubacterium sp.]